MNFKNLTIGKKLGLLSGILFASLLIIAFQSFLTIRDLDFAQKDLGKTQLPAIRIITLTDMYHDNIRGTFYKSLKVAEGKDAAQINEAKEEVETVTTEIKTNFAKLDELELDKQTKESIKEVSPLIEKYAATGKEISGLALNGQIDKAKENAAELEKDFKLLEASLDKLADLIEKNADKSVENSASIVSWAILKLILVLVASLIVSVIVNLFVARSLLNPMHEMTEAASRLAVGDVEQNIEYRSKDEIGVLADSFRASIAHTRDIARAAELIKSGNLDEIKLAVKSDKDVLTQSFIKVGKTLNNLNGEMQKLISSAEAGNLSKRGNVAEFEGSYAELINGINHVLDAFTAPINEASEVLEQAAKRDLTAKMKGDYKGEFAKIKDSLNTALENLDEGMKQISSGAEQVATAAGQISDGSSHLAQSSSEQASTLEEVSSSLHEIAAMTKQNANNSLEAKSLSENAHRITKDGIESMSVLNGA
ncbi:MAG TPA: HAMP domain-containing protein, partial [Pyrinomonadaceae bacterium]|nr:HAMP domain-containing protein [Pyrinomonadaceae bacterium]